MLIFNVDSLFKFQSTVGQRHPPLSNQHVLKFKVTPNAVNALIVNYLWLFANCNCWLQYHNRCLEG